jgi:hypothetical protein
VVGVVVLFYVASPSTAPTEVFRLDDRRGDVTLVTHTAGVEGAVARTLGVFGAAFMFAGLASALLYHPYEGALIGGAGIGLAGVALYLTVGDPGAFHIEEH